MSTKPSNGSMKISKVGLSLRQWAAVIPITHEFRLTRHYPHCWAGQDMSFNGEAGARNRELGKAISKIYTLHAPRKRPRISSVSMELIMSTLDPLRGVPISLLMN